MIRRSRLTLLSMLVLVAAVALVSRSGRAAFLPSFMKMYAGDTLWASALYLLLAFFRPSATPFDILMGTLVISVAVECSQLYRAPWINSIRHTFPFGYILGYGFKWSDTLCYAAGSLLAYAIDMVQTGRRRF